MTDEPFTLGVQSKSKSGRFGPSLVRAVQITVFRLRSVGPPRCARDDTVFFRLHVTARTSLMMAGKIPFSIGRARQDNRDPFLEKNAADATKEFYDVAAASRCTTQPKPEVAMRQRARRILSVPKYSTGILNGAGAALTSIPSRLAANVLSEETVHRTSEVLPALNKLFVHGYAPEVLCAELFLRGLSLFGNSAAHGPPQIAYPLSTDELDEIQRMNIENGCITARCAEGLEPATRKSKTTYAALEFKNARTGTV
ncbi:hypothetical protein DFH06DRAFT_1137581 [Mycena polygramma]|nr:hypothetical protein DFH06DRAFT_1137581 [Mycena polygramma]